MTNKVVFIFPPTVIPGNIIEAYVNENTDQLFDKNVVRIYLDSCAHKNMGNGYLLPDLAQPAQSIRSAFSAETKTLDIKKLKEVLGDAVITIRGLSDSENPILAVHEICLTGFSRGAVTTFAVAKQLNDLQIPMHIIADRPVAGELFPNLPWSLYANHHDLSEYNNIKSSVTLIAAHDLEQSFIHKYFFKQMLARLPESTYQKTILMPHQHHFYDDSNIFVAYNKLKEYMRINFLRPIEPESNESLNTLKARYLEVKAWEGHVYTPEHCMQEVIGAQNNIPKDPLYLELVKDTAQKILDDISIKTPNNKALSDEQAYAIYCISKLHWNRDPYKKHIMEYIVSDTDQSQKLISIVTKIHTCCFYLKKSTKDRSTGKSEAIASASHKYQIDIFKLSFDYLKLEPKNQNDKSIFIDKIKEAQNIFEQKALSIDRNSYRKILCALTNFILVCTGLFLIANTLNKAINNEWFFFSQTRSTNLMRETLNQSLSYMP